jgi:hypothetical protein
MQTEYLILDHSCQWQVVEKFSEDFPHVGITVLPQALIVEPVANTLNL